MNWRRWSRDRQIRFNRDDGHVSSLYVYVYRIYVKYTYPRRRATLSCRSVRPHDRFLFRISVVSHGTHMCKRAPLPSQHISRHTLHFVFNVTSHSSPNRSQWVPTSDRAWWSDILIISPGWPSSYFNIRRLIFFWKSNSHISNEIWNDNNV